jgi:hypothetical protein
MKYAFNQATAYHMRLGRRYHGAVDGETELKRSLVRWHLPEVPAGSRVVAARMGVWVEEFSIDSPLADGRQSLPLHVYAYALSTDWEPGQGGVGRDSFSDAAPGESSWIDARTGSLPWPAPGALSSDNPGPLAVAPVDGGGSEIVFASGALSMFLERCLAEGRTFDVLMKLADEEEDRWGTEIALLSSEFGIDGDAFPKRPWLEFDIEIPATIPSVEHEFVVEAGGEVVFPAIDHPSDQAFLAAEVSESELSDAPAALWYRGGAGEVILEDWTPLVHPVRRPAGWSQVKITPIAHRIPLGAPFSVSLLETWINPGPREEQTPELVAVGPSGAVVRVRGVTSPDFRYTMEFRPNEPGIWRYGWSFLPRWQGPPGSNQGEGFFYVTPPTSTGTDVLRSYSDELIESFRGRASADAAAQYRLNAFIRWIARARSADESMAELSEREISRVREASPDRVDQR